MSVSKNYLQIQATDNAYQSLESVNILNKPKTFLEPLFGYILDAIARLRQRAFVPHSLTKLQNINYARKMTNAETAIEVGSYKGVTTRRLSRYFKNVTSIEIDESLYQQARDYCIDCKNVEIILGDGAECLSELVANSNRALLFLDGHYSGGVTGIGDEPEPVLKEIDQIKSHLKNIVAIVIDDFRLFGVEDGWPKKYEVIRKLESDFPSEGWNIHVQYDQILVMKKTGRVS